MDNIGELLGKRDFAKPSEIDIIQQFIADHYSSKATVKISDFQITIIVNGASLGNSLRIDMPKLVKQLNTKKRILIRIA